MPARPTRQRSLAVLAVAVVALASTGTAAAATYTFNAVADAYVHESKPRTNYGKALSVKADASPRLRGFVRFNVTGIQGTVTRATLRVRGQNTSSTGLRVHQVS